MELFKTSLMKFENSSTRLTNQFDAVRLAIFYDDEFSRVPWYCEDCIKMYLFIYCMINE